MIKTTLDLLLSLLIWGCLLLLPSAYSFVTAQNPAKLDSLSRAYASAQQDSTKVITGLSLTREMQRHKLDPGEIYELAEKNVDLALSLKDTLLYARALDNLGLIYRFHQNYKEALAIHTRAFELVENGNFPNIHKMIIADNAGLAARYDQNYDLAISYYMKALEMAEQAGNLRNIAIASNGIGNALGNIPGREEEAIEFFKRSLDAEQKRNNSLGVAMNYLSISDYYIEKRDFKTAHEYLAKLLEINNQRNDEFGLAITYQFMGLAYLKEEINLDKAIFYFKTALERFDQLGNFHKQAEIYGNLGESEWKKNNTKEAESYFEMALVLGMKLKRFDIIENTSLSLSNLMEEQKDYEKALVYYKQSEAYKDSINLGEQNLTIESLIRKYDITQKENYIQMLEKDKVLHQTLLKNQEEQLKTRRMYVLFLTIGITLLLVIFVLQYRNYVGKKKAQKRISEEEKAKLNAVYERNLARAETIANRLRINPHFLFNSLNAITYLIRSNQNAEAIEYLGVFSRYTRMLLETSTKQVVPVQEELDLARLYMILEENRFEKDFSFEIIGEDSPELDLIKIPPLLLQPFIENAIWHGLLPLENKERKLRIEVFPHEDFLEILIDDNGVGRSSKQAHLRGKHKSLGIKITNERIDLFNKSYGDNIHYEIIDKVDENGRSAGTKVVIKLVFEELV